MHGACGRARSAQTSRCRPAEQAAVVDGRSLTRSGRVRGESERELETSQIEWQGDSRGGENASDLLEPLMQVVAGLGEPGADARRSNRLLDEPLQVFQL